MNPEMDALLERAVVTISRSDRAQVLSQIVHRMSDELVFMGLYYVVQPTFINNRLANVTAPGPSGGTQVWNVQEWTVK
jgi:ABC-type transport system substrate-binding protein